jgi:hypothetical protein
VRIPKYSLHKASKQAVVDILGKSYQCGAHNSPESKRAYARIVAEYLAIPSSFVVSKTDPTIAELLLAYSKFCRVSYGLVTISEWWRVKPLLKVLRQLYADIAVREFGPPQFKAVRQYMLDGKHRTVDSREKLSRNYAKQMSKRLKRIFRWGVSESIVPVEV